MDFSKWEVFQDDSYYDAWAVRPVGDRDFHSPYLFHTIKQRDAENLKNFLEANLPKDKKFEV